MKEYSNNRKIGYEVKILNINIEAVEKKLLTMGARKIFDRLMTRTLIFDHPLLRLRQTGKVLRLRQVGRKVFLSIKEGLEGAKRSPFQKVIDSELELNDFNQAFQLFESLGFYAFRYLEKFRSAYTFPRGIRIEIDQPPKIPPFLEIEGESEEEVRTFVKNFGYRFEDTVSLSATEILRHYGLKDVDVIKFPDSKELSE